MRASTSASVANSDAESASAGSGDSLFKGSDSSSNGVGTLLSADGAAVLNSFNAALRTNRHQPPFSFTENQEHTTSQPQFHSRNPPHP